MMDLTKLSRDELDQLNKDIDKELKHRHRESVKLAQKQMRELASSYGVSIEELVPGVVRLASRGGASSTPLSGRFVHPDDPKKTWNGRGRKPNWLKEWEAAGRSPEALRVA